MCLNTRVSHITESGMLLLAVPVVTLCGKRGVIYNTYAISTECCEGNCAAYNYGRVLLYTAQLTEV